MLEMFVCTMEQCRNAPFGSLVEAEPAPSGEDVATRVKKASNGVPQCFLLHTRRFDGKAFWIEANMRIATIGRQQCILVTVRDISDRIQVQQEKFELERKLHQAEKMEAVGRLAGGVAHDFNNQLAGIMGYAQLLLMHDNIPSACREDIEAIYTAATRSADLTTQLLSFARKGSFTLEVIDIHKQIAGTIELLKRSIDKRISFVSDLKALRFLVKGNRSQIQSALLNLGINGCDAMGASGTLIFATAMESFASPTSIGDSFVLLPGEYIRVRIIDTGIGIDPEIQPHIFEPFFTTKGVGKGTGLGLSAVYGTMKSHHGAVSVENRIGQGCTFSLFLPLADEEITHVSAESQNRHGANTHILLVDDEDIVRKSMASLLQRMGYSTSESAGGEDALSIYRSKYQTIDLVVLDMVMPVYGGSHLFREFRAINPACKILLVSGCTIHNEVQALLDAGARGFIQKPCDARILEEKIRSILSGKSGSQEG